MATLIQPDGTQRTVEPANGTDFQLEELQKMVGGYIEVIPTFDGRTMVIHEEGKLLGLPANPVATALYKYNKYRLYDIIVGPVVLCRDEEVK